MGRMLSALLIGSLLVCAPLRADDSNSGDAAAKTATPAKTETNNSGAAKPATDYREEIEELRQMMREQAQQMAEQQKQLELLRAQLAATHSSAASPAPSAETATVHVVNGDMGAVRSASGPSAAAAQDKPKSEDSPASIRYKGITITPGGFFAAETVYRTRAISADDNTPFTSTPFNGNSLSKVSEMNFGGRQSRVSALLEGNIGTAKIGGYFEADFQGAGTTSNNRQSNSYVFRQRQAFAQVALNSGWTFTGGQQWSLATETRKGILNRQEATPLVVDHQYNVGFTWARQYGFRVVKNFDDKFALAFSVEGPQTTIGGRGFTSYSNTSATGVVTAAQNFFLNAPGNSGGLYNAFDATGYTANKAPDFILKAALDPGWGHYELFGIVSEFRNRIYPCALNTPTAGTNAAGTAVTQYTAGAQVTCAQSAATSPNAAGAFNDSRTGGGAGASARVPFFAKKLELNSKFTAGSGIGRYGSAQLPDATARPDGTLALLKSAQWLSGAEIHPNPKLDLYAYFGQEYAGRAAYTGYTTVRITNTPFIPAVAATGQPFYPSVTNIAVTTTAGGYGSPFANNSLCSTETTPAATGTPGTGGACAGDIRAISEASIGFWHKFYNSPKGGLRWGVQYSYLTKSAWSGNNNTPANAGISPKAVNNMVFLSFRYYLP
ncbi:MAG: hypothetical protein JSS69_08480 [Acidobacteria bacterium]|nr:hypothetical protein [Acidobacteriota bacterium]MBS1865941.1 hypothetical protein [Acidobacteriota bacterium]